MRIESDGRELFGPQTGSGFGEFASYDAADGWIDENYPVFSKLRIWTQDRLSTLREKGVDVPATTEAAAVAGSGIKNGAHSLPRKPAA